MERPALVCQANFYEPPSCQVPLPVRLPPFEFKKERVVVAVLWGLWAGPKGSSTNPQDPAGSRHGRGPGILFQVPFPLCGNGLPVSSHCSFPLLSRRFGATRGCSRQNVAVPRRAQRRVQTLVRFGWPTDAGLVTTMPFRAVRRSGRRDPSARTVPRSAVNQASRRSHALPGFPGGPVGPPGCPDVSLSSAQARDRTAPSGTIPAVAYLHSDTSSLRASATMPRFRERPSRALT